MFFKFGSSGGIEIAGWYVNDGLLAGDSSESMSRMVRGIEKVFQIQDLGEPNRPLGIKISMNGALGHIHLSQPLFISTIVKRYNIPSGHCINSPMDHITALSPSTDHVKNMDLPYPSLIGSLNYCAIPTRPDIAYAVNKCAQYTAQPTLEHWEAAKRIVRYLLHMQNHGITFKPAGTGINGYVYNLAGFTDADFAGDRTDHKSTTRWLFTFNGAPISWASKKQNHVTRLSMESELVSSSFATAEGIWIIRLGKDFGQLSTPISIYTDNQSFISFAKNDVNNSHTKHIDTHFHYTQEQITEGAIELKYIKSLDNPADILTKALSPHKHLYLLAALGVSPA